VLLWKERKGTIMDDTTAGDRDDEVVTEFDQTNGKAPGLEGDGRDVDADGDRNDDPDDDLDPLLVGDGSADGHREPLVTRLTEDLVDGPSEEERRD
jgi:hypothetical protein